MAGREGRPANITPQAPFARIALHVLNTTIDVPLLNRLLGSKSEPLYQGVIRKALPQAKPTREMITNFKMTRQMTSFDGSLCFMFAEGTANSRYKKSTGDPSEVCVPVFSSLVGLRRINKPAGEVRFTREQQEYECLTHEHSLTFVGVALPPAADQENKNNFITATAGNMTIVNTGNQEIKAGQLIAYRVPRPDEFKFGYFTDEANPIAWVVPVDRKTWDLNQRVMFIKRATEHFAAIPADEPKKINLGTMCLNAMYVAGDNNAVTMKMRRERMRDLVADHIMGLPEFDVAVVQIVLAYLLGSQRNAAVTANPNADRADFFATVRTPGYIGEVFMNAAHDLVPAVRSVVRATDHTIFGKAHESAKKGGEFLARIGMVGS